MCSVAAWVTVGEGSVTTPALEPAPLSTETATWGPGNTVSSQRSARGNPPRGDGVTSRSAGPHSVTGLEPTFLTEAWFHVELVVPLLSLPVVGIGDISRRASLGRWRGRGAEETRTTVRARGRAARAGEGTRRPGSRPLCTRV